MRKVIIAPSVLSLDYADLANQVKQLNASAAEWLHFDVMDGHFVPNLTFGPDILKGFKKISNLFLDVHIMVEDPIYFADVFAKAGADLITFHYEALSDLSQIKQLSEKLHQQNIKVGLSIKPNTAVTVYENLLPYIDVALIMSVEPGFGGQSFMPNSLEKISYLREKIDQNNYQCLIQVDGGINADTAKLVKDAGVDVLVAGSYVFKNDIQKAVLSLC